jgi:hypothetical protein
MDYKITEVFLDEANKYRTRVIIDENSTHFFKFDHYPTQEEVNELVVNYLKISETDASSIGIDDIIAPPPINP